MKKILFITLGTILLLPLYAAEALGISLDTFREEVLKPDNLPTSRETAAPAEVKINEIIQFAINMILYASGGIAVFFLVVSGIRYIASFGNQELMDGAKKTMKHALIGLLVVILSYAAVTNIIDLIYKAAS
ncbi:hypothetical protein ACFL6I_05655 [candidate division KSB1 bacterium]